MTHRTDPKDERLKTVRLFANLDVKDLRHASRLVSEVDRPAGTVLFEEGGYGGEAFVIRTGAVSVWRGGMELARAGSGDIVGEFALIDGRPRSATAVAETDVALFVLNRSEFDRLINEVPVVARRVLALLVARLRGADLALDGA